MNVHSGTAFTILLASETPSYRNNLASSLRMQGYSVEVATGGFHLLHLIENSPDISLIIIHDDMFDMSGYEIVSLIRVSKSNKELPVIFISKDNNKEKFIKMLEVEANDYVVQTPIFQPVISTVKKYCSN